MEHDENTAQAAATNDNVDMELLIKEDGLWLHRPHAHPQLINLGEPDKVFQVFADKMAELDFGS